MFIYLAKLINALNANVKPSQISNAVCLGLLLGFVPKSNALWYLLFVFFCFVRVHKATYLSFTLIGTIIAPPFDWFFDKVGFAILTYEPCNKYFAFLLDVPFVAFTKFNNTIVMGSLATALALYIPLCILLYFFIKLWRKTISPKINNSIIYGVLQKIPLLGTIIEKVSNMQK